LHGFTLRINDRFLGRNNNFCFHLKTNSCCCPQQVWVNRSVEARKFWEGFSLARSASLKPPARPQDFSQPEAAFADKTCSVLLKTGQSRP
jgi:hypothetical protein